tara:strand:+ start:1277 stop:1519 length:243 start_codon:yes stop_codon:yes gene_type:complete
VAKGIAYHAQSAIAILAMPFALGSMLLPLSIPIGLVGIFWHPFDLPTGLNALAMAGLSAVAGLICMGIAGAILSVAQKLE